MRLRDGRVLAWAEFGDPSGTPLLYFHGQPGSRLGGAMLDAAGSRHAVRVIAPDRPGYGLSDFKPARALLDWADDVGELTDALALPRFAVAGASSGGPYVSACAHNIPERLTCAIIVSGNAPFDAPGATDGMMRMNRLYFGLARRAPFISDALTRLAARQARHPERAMKFAKSSMPPSDIRVVEHPEIIAVFERDFPEAFRQGARGAAYEARMFGRPWGFRLEDIRVRVHLWQGEEDRNVPPSMGRYQARTIPHCTARFFPGEGHALLWDHLDEFMEIVRDHMGG